MGKIIIFLSVNLMVAINCLWNQSSICNSENYHNVKTLLSKMHLIDGGSIIVRDINYNKITKKDSTLLFGLYPFKSDYIEPFYISATEVTNLEYREFYLEQVKLLGVRSAKELYFPNVSLWRTEHSNAELYVENYFDHERFDHYPVVGVNWNQCSAYCNWKSEKLRLELKKRGLDLELEFRLPTEAEWELAAKGQQVKRIGDPNKYYPWGGELFINENKYLANFGRIIDQNGFLIKNFSDDGHLYTSPVASFPPNDNGLFDMAGNVSEWLNDITKYDSKTSSHLEDLDRMDDSIKELNQRIGAGEIEWESFLKNMEHDKNILIKSDMHSIKGGSWSDGPVYMQIGSVESRESNDASATLGFRLAMSFKQGEHNKYFPQTYWKPKYK